MTIMVFLAEWALRSSVLIPSGGLLLWALRVKDPSIRLAAWIALLCGSIAMPLFTASAPKMPVVTINRVVEAPVTVFAAPPIVLSHRIQGARRFDWWEAAEVAYGLVAVALLVRLFVGLAMSLRLLRRSQSTGESIDGIEIRESDGVSAPVTLGIVRPAIVLPVDWRRWDAARLNVVLAHERSHVRRFDPAVQLLSAAHRALLWVSPMTWFLHKQIVRTAEEASDDAALAAHEDRALYAEVLIGFMRPGARGSSLPGVPMARYGSPEARIHRILEGTVLSRGLTRRSLAAILVVGLPLTYVVAASQAAQQTQSAPRATDTIRKVPAPAAVQAPQTKPKSSQGYLTGLGNVVGSETVVVRAQTDGMLRSIEFREGAQVQQGQVLASIDRNSGEIQFTQAEGNLEQDKKQLTLARGQVQAGNQPSTILPPLEVKVNNDTAEVRALQLRLELDEIRSPISGVAGLRMIDAGNIIHAGEPLVVIARIQPAAVLFTLPEDALPQVRRSLTNGASPVVEAWTRDFSVRIATGRLEAVDNRIDEQTGTVKLKALFDNKDGALVPGQFVNARLLVSNR
jgi:multidrug efflux system membrane fusion protein